MITYFSFSVTPFTDFIASDRQYKQLRIVIEVNGCSYQWTKPFPENEFKSVLDHYFEMGKEELLKLITAPTPAAK